jgi:lipoprotein-anchoring transpeptidase ErfK/SrfK
MKFLKYLFIIIIASSSMFTNTVIKSPVFATNVITDGKLITVDLKTQTLFAWENGKVVFQAKVSSGLPKTPTVKGSFNIRTKIPFQRMKGGGEFYAKYDYPNVPNVMYFYQGYAIHGAYWHNRFGRTNSHGCVNVSVPDSQWLYNFANVGTRVEIY